MNYPETYEEKIFTGEWEVDNFIMTSYLDQVEFYSGTERRKMLKVKKGNGSMLYGLTWRSWLSPEKQRTKCEKTGLYKTKVMDDYPELEKIFREFANLYFPKHLWEQCQMNRNFPCPKHTDSSNISTSSILCCFGDYEGGLTCVDYGMAIRKYDGREAPVEFDGKRYTHWVEPITSGTRYSLVFFSNKSVRKMIKENKNKLLL